MNLFDNRLSLWLIVYCLKFTDIDVIHSYIDIKHSYMNIMHSYILLYGCSSFCVLNIVSILMFYSICQITKRVANGMYHLPLFYTILLFAEFQNFYLQCFNTLFAEFQNSWSNIAAFKTDDENILFHVT